jgi:hypothetical protein
MRESTPLWLDLLRFLLLLLILPFALLILGPLLVIAALFGEVVLGWLHISPNRSGNTGRALALGLGLLLWALTWGGLAWLGLGGPTPTAPTLTENEPSPTVSVAATALSEVAFSTPDPSPRLTALPTSTATSAPVTATAVSPADTETPPATATPSPTTTTEPLPAPPTPTPTASATNTPPPPTATPNIAADSTVSSAQASGVLDALTAANALFIEAVENPGPAQQAALAELWQDQALIRIEEFTARTLDRYDSPLTVTYRFAEPPTLRETGGGTVSLQALEYWRFTDPNGERESLTNYTYIFTPAPETPEEWVITFYTFEVLTQPDGSVITETTVISE